MLSHGRLSILSNVRSEYYSATAAESAAVLSTAATVSTVSTTAASTVSTVVESAFSAPLLAALFPQDAKETAANAQREIVVLLFFFFVDDDDEFDVVAELNIVSVCVCVCV